MYIVRPPLIWLCAVTLGYGGLDWLRFAIITVILARFFYSETKFLFRRMKIVWLGPFMEKSKYEYKLLLSFAVAVPLVPIFGGFVFGWAIAESFWFVLLPGFCVNIISLVFYLFLHKFVI
jgi:hypothetical protein